MADKKVGRGFKSYRKELKDNGRMIRTVRDCSSCTYFYADKGKKEEYCHNDQVTPFDYYSDGNKSYCTFWVAVGFERNLD